MEIRTCWAYDRKTKEYEGITTAFENPLDGGFNLPANATFVEPPQFGEFETAVFNGESWAVVPDYRRHLDNTGTFVGGKPYYDPAKYWWDEGSYMETFGDIPSGMTFTKMDTPQIVVDVVNLENQIQTSKDYLADTDYVHNVILEEPEKAEKYAPVIEERKRVRASIDPTEEQISNLKNQIVSLYGEEALNHLSV